MKEFFTANAGVISLVVSPVVTLLCCSILLINDIASTKVDSTLPHSSVFCDAFPIFDADICGLEVSFDDIFVSQLLPSSAAFTILCVFSHSGAHHKGQCEEYNGFPSGQHATPSALGISQRSLNTFHASSSEHFHISYRSRIFFEYV